MRTLKLPTLSYRAQVLIILGIVGLWYLDIWILRHSGDRAPAVCDVIAFALPILTPVLSYLVLDTRIRRRQLGDAWFYVGLLGGLVPWVSICN
jgi:hypothetical protein